MTYEALNKIDNLIEESGSNFLDLGTNGKRLLAAKIADLTEKERDRLGYISKRLSIGVKNGLIDAALGAAIAGLGAAAALGSAPIAAVAAALVGTSAGVAGWKKSRDEANKGSDMSKTMGSKEIEKLVKELEGLIGKPMVKLIKLNGKLRLN